MYIQKEDGRQRPLGVAALEDKIVQYAVATILNQIYEEDFLGFSYGGFCFHREKVVAPENSVQVRNSDSGSFSL